MLTPVEVDSSIQDADEFGLTPSNSLHIPVFVGVLGSRDQQ